jgi:putative flippase GtrA
MPAAMRTHAQFLRFALVGCAGFLVDAGVLNVVLLLGADRYAGRIVSYLAAATFTWALNRHYTFRAQRDTRRVREWASFLAANAVGGLINWSTYAVLVAVSPTVYAHPVLGVAAGSIAGLVVNFTLSREYVFGERKGRRIDWTIVALVLITCGVMLGLKVNPWPRDGWFETQYFIVGHFPGHDNDTPIAAPAMLYALAHLIAAGLRLDLAGEMYVGVALQNLLILLSACFVYFTLKSMRLTALAGPVAIAFLLLVLSTGLPQSFYSESTVIFMMAAVMLVIAVLPPHADAGGTRFWVLTLTCALLVGLLVLTRMTPIFLIPAIALLFFRRMPVRRVVQVTAAMGVATVLFLAVTVLANHARFGRYELTNSSGRHLWQGVMQLTDDPKLRGLNWWEVPPLPPDGGLYTMSDPRDPALAAASKEIIRKEPGRYLVQGAKKFFTTIAVAPYHFGTGSYQGHSNPLNRTELLPPLASAMHAGFYARVVEAVMRRVYIAFTWGYPLTIVAIAITWLARAFRRDKTAGAPLISYFSFLALMFFGSLWFSWQIEIENSRNAVPYMPEWALMLAIGAAYWWGIVRASRAVGRAEAVDPRPADAQLVVEQRKVGAVARRDATELVAETEVFGGVLARHPQRFRHFEI